MTLWQAACLILDGLTEAAGSTTARPLSRNVWLADGLGCREEAMAPLHQPLRKLMDQQGTEKRTAGVLS